MRAPEIRLDRLRHRRRGVPEVIFGAGKTPAQILRMARGLSAGRKVSS